MVITILKIYLLIVIGIMIAYAVRHMIFAYNRMFGRQRIYYQDIYSSDMPKVSVLVPMHNEEKVLHFVMNSLLECSYDRDKLEIIPINDNSTDRTEELLEEYRAKHDFIRPLHRKCEDRGKPAGLNDAMKIATGDIIIVFDADYRPSRDLVRQIALAFLDPDVGAVMGRVIPYNTNTNLLTRLLNLERSGGYQADQQARYNLRLMPQYGGTVGGFRKSILMQSGGFNARVLAEDTELTYRIYTSGWKVVYANSAECYEESPETWKARGRQVRRWSRGHNQVLFHYLFPTICSHHMSRREKTDGVFLLFVYAVPFLTALAQLVSVALFLLGEMNLMAGWWVLLFIGAYNSFGNFAPFYEIGSALLMDGIRGEARLLPLLTFSFYFYLWHISLGFLDACADALTHRRVVWAKTARFTREETGGPG